MKWLVVTVALYAAFWQDVEKIVGRAGSAQPGDVYKFSFPRTDLAVDIDGVRIKPALALGSWAAFHGGMVMGDLALTENEVNDVISAFQAGGIEQTAVHNHLLRESPRVAYVHFEGHGDRVSLARTLRAALEKTKTPLTTAPSSQPDVDLPTADLDRIIGASGKANGGVYQFTIARAEKIVENGMEIPPAMGVATAINFQATTSGRAVTTGDFVMTANEVNSVIRALRRGGISITALHSHMIREQPRLFFMHFWGNDDVLALAKTLRAALDTMRMRR
jgi:hypothetical protein